MDKSIGGQCPLKENMDEHTQTIDLPIEQKPPDCKEEDWMMLERLRFTLGSMRANKPNDRSDRDHRYAVAITSMEKALAYFHTYVVHHE
jgi:hypothetical protein